jgi:uncharacterized membrane protein YphA (DoxX/SURF4 family)
VPTAVGETRTSLPAAPLHADGGLTEQPKPRHLAAGVRLGGRGEVKPQRCGCYSGLPTCLGEVRAFSYRAGPPLSVAGVRQLLISEPGLAIREDRVAANVAIVAGVIFVFAGLVKFAFHGWELNAFRSFGLPWPSALELFAGVLETFGGFLLALRLLVAPVALLLAATMAVAIGASGVGHGDVIPSLTLAPALLLAMVFVLARTLHFRPSRPASVRRGRRT